MVEVTADGTIYAFVYGQGLGVGEGGHLQLVDRGLTTGVSNTSCISPSIRPTRKRLFAATGDGQVLASNGSGADLGAVRSVKRRSSSPH